MKSFPYLPGYELVRPLGGGPLTQVFAGRNCLDDRLCAVKVLRPDWDDPTTALLLMRREARLGLAVQHPHVVPYLLAHVLKPPYFLVMRLLEGISLRQRLLKERCLDVTSAIRIARETAGALAALHHKGYLHGDLKPENIFLQEDDWVRLIDLGSAHRPGENNPLTEQGYILGTPDYLAPELCAFHPELDESADLFSLGVVLFEMLAGTLPYPRGSVSFTLRCHRDSRPSESPLHALSLPPRLIGLVRRLLDAGPTNRPRARAVEAQLRALEGFGDSRWLAA